MFAFFIAGYKTVHCDICGQGFIKKVHYTSHMLNTHGLKVLETDPKVQSVSTRNPRLLEVHEMHLVHNTQ